LLRGLDDSGTPWAHIDEAALGAPLPAGGGGGSAPQWAYLESDFLYTAHRTAITEGVGRAVSSAAEDAVGTRFPLVLLFELASSVCQSTSALGTFAEWLRAPPRPFCPRTRLVLVVVGGPKSVGLRAEQAAALAGSLVQHGVGSVEVFGVDHAAQYVLQSVSSVHECRRRRVPSRFKVAGVRCQTLPRDPQDKLRLTWVSQLMQVAGVSEEIAKAISERYPSPGLLMQAVTQVAQGRGSSASSVETAVVPMGLPPTGKAAAGSVADSFLADLEYPIRGKKGTRRLGPVVSRRVFTLFHPETPPEHVLL